MPFKFPHKRFIVNWLKALTLSPGILFPATYLLVYLSTSTYLNNAFKAELYQSIDRASGQNVTITVKSITPNLQLDTMTLSHIQIIAVERDRNNNNASQKNIKKPKLTVRCPNLQQLLFNKEKRHSSIRVISKTLLADYHVAQ